MPITMGDSAAAIASHFRVSQSQSGIIRNYQPINTIIVFILRIMA
jgi:hypothetical protein